MINPTPLTYDEFRAALMAPWEKKFAYFPTRVNDEWVWWNEFYERYDTLRTTYQRGTLFDVLRTN
jgi:hypothetical protein